MQILLASSFGAYLFALFRKEFIYAGVLLQLAYLLFRASELGRLPLVGPHDTIVFFTACAAAFSLPFGRLMKGEKAFGNIISVSSALFTALALVYEPRNFPLPPVLKTFWFETHVVLAFMSYALFGVAAVFGYLYLKAPQSLAETLQYKAVLIAYCLFTLSMIFGGIWAYLAWGTYWLWTPKELWTSILWIFYSFYLHARLRQWWAGRPAAVLGIAGFGVVMFTYLGVSLLMKSSHSF
ncbi:MAG: cytochrome c biogenesis protein CcsA [Nitrospirae bacterium]|nr:cytochrome c biogenesis protein CcsA [Nitrospirota bacterium]